MPAEPRVAHSMLLELIPCAQIGPTPGNVRTACNYHNLNEINRKRELQTTIAKCRTRVLTPFPELHISQGNVPSQADHGVEDPLDHGTNFVRTQRFESHLEFVVALRAIAHRLLDLHKMQ